MSETTVTNNEKKDTPRVVWPALIDASEVLERARQFSAKSVGVIVRVQFAPGLHIDCENLADAEELLTLEVNAKPTPESELAKIRRYLVEQCGMRDVGTTLDMVRGIGYVAWKARQPGSNGDVQESPSPVSSTD